MVFSLLPFIKSNSFKDISIIVRALAGANQSHPVNKEALMRKLTLLKTQIEDKSLKVCTKIPPLVPTCEQHSHCKMYKDSCWCFNNHSDHEQREACGYESGYSGTYYSIVSSGAPRDLILAMGLKPHPQYCRSNSDCSSGNCMRNECRDNGCFGTNLGC